MFGPEKGRVASSRYKKLKVLRRPPFDPRNRGFFAGFFKTDSAEPFRAKAVITLVADVEAIRLRAGQLWTA